MAKEVVGAAYGQDRGEVRLSLDAFVDYVVVGRTRDEGVTVLTSLDAAGANELVGLVGKLNEDSPHNMVSDRDPARDPRLYNDPSFISAEEHSAARAEAGATDANADLVPESKKMDPSGNKPWRTDAAAKDYPTTEAQAKLAADPDVGSIHMKKGAASAAARKSVVNAPVVKKEGEPGVDGAKEAKAAAAKKAKAAAKQK